MDQTLQRLHDQIDADYDQKVAKLQEDRTKDHAALDRVWPILAQSPLPGMHAVVSAEPELVEAQPEANGNGRPFPMMMRVESFFDEHPTREISQQTIYNSFITEYPELRKREEGHLRGQISTTLAKLVERGYIELVRRGTGGNPHIYRRAEEA